MPRLIAATIGNRLKYGQKGVLTMFLNIAIKQPFLTHRLLNIRKELILLASMMLMHNSVPTQTIANEICVVCWLNIRTLDDDAIQTAHHGVVYYTHCACGFHVRVGGSGLEVVSCLLRKRR